MTTQISTATSMGNETKEETNSKEITKERLNKDYKRKEVIITVYVESPSPPSSINARRKGGGDRHNDHKKRNNKSRPAFISKNPQNAKTRGYDRRTQLLAYARELRKNPDSKLQPEWPQNNSKPKAKASIVTCMELKDGIKQMSMKKLSNPVRIEFVKTRKKYHRLVPEVHISCQPKSVILRNNMNKKKGNRHTDFRFVGKLRGIMTGFCKE